VTPFKYVDERKETRIREVKAFLRYRNERKWEVKKENGNMKGLTQRLFNEWLIRSPDSKRYWVNNESNPFETE